VSVIPTPILRILVVGAALFLTAAVGVDVLDEEIRPKRLVEAEPGLFRAGQISPRLIHRVLEENGIGKVIWMLHYDPARRTHRAEKKAIEALGIERHHFPLRGDGTGKLGRYADAIAEVAEAQRNAVPVLVHCAAGSRRSAGVVAMYQLLVEGRPAAEVYRELDRFGNRPVAASPLLPYLNENMGELAEQLVERGVIERVPDPLPLLQPPVRSSLRTRLARWVGGVPPGSVAGL